MTVRDPIIPRVLRFFKARPPGDTAILIPGAIAAGLVLWLSVRSAQSLLSGLLHALPEWIALTLNAGVEESFRFAFALLLMAMVLRTGVRPKLVLYGVVASWALASAENLSYLAAFPSADVYWRLGYSLPIHVNAAALYAVALAPSPNAARAATALRGGVAFLVGWGWHAAFNVVAGIHPFAALPALGSALNLGALIILVVLIESTFVIQGALHGRRQA
ncbi:MAG: hypothetical protein E4H20_10335 [Spirochaetales bacterium]|nr:MAG: hypothetical protein E4H20_10335 [Spirochaetales bacterium]